MKITQTVAALAKPIVEARGCSLWDVEYVREGADYILRVAIDKEGGVDIDDCEAISRALDPILDEHDPIVWLKVSDGAGYCTVTPYSVTPYQDPAKVDVNSLEERVKRLEEMINAKPDDADAAKERKKPQ